MIRSLKVVDLVALGFMTFALFLGAGNIIFPPMVGHLSGDRLWDSALGFLLTGVGLPLLTVVALARVGGGLDALTAPIGKGAGILLGALVFGIVIIHAIRSRGILDARLQTRYAIIAGIIAATGLALVYLSLIWLGASSGVLAPDAATGAPILTAFVHYIFGPKGNVLLAIVITLACLTTAAGLVAACGDYFSRLLPISYRRVVVIVSLISMIVANQGLEQLITVSVPVLLAIYPVAIALVALSLASSLWRQPSRVFVPTLMVAAVFGILDGMAAAGFAHRVPDAVSSMPGASLGLGWLVPVLVMLFLSATYDRLQNTQKP